MSNPAAMHANGTNRFEDSPDALERLRNGDRALFEELVRTHHRALVAAARPLVGDEAEEVVQNAWIKAHESLARFEGRSTLRTWLTRIVLNEARMMLRKRRREVKLDDNPDGSDPLGEHFSDTGSWSHPPGQWKSGDNPDALLMGDELAECLETLLGDMPENQRVLLEMRDAGGIPFDEICNELGLSASNARVILHRARGRMFRLVDHYQETGEC